MPPAHSPAVPTEAAAPAGAAAAARPENSRVAGSPPRVGRQRRRSALAPGVLALALVLPACGLRIGPRADRIGAQVQGQGVMVELRVRDGGEATRRLTGELLDVREDAVLVLGDSLWLIEYDAIRELDAQRHPLAPRGTWLMRPEDRAYQLRPTSRYAHGMPPGVQERLLAALGHADIVHIRPPARGQP